MDDIKQFAKKWKLETLIQIMRIHNQNTGMGFGIEKCAMFIRKSGKRQSMERIEQPYQEKIRTLE